MLIPLVVIGLIIWLVLSASSRERVKSAFRGNERKDPFDIAKERYAKGEITREQYEQIKRDLS